jgi:hypothetical protein
VVKLFTFEVIHNVIYQQETANLLAVDLIKLGTKVQSNSSFGFNLKFCFILYAGSHDQLGHFRFK